MGISEGIFRKHWVCQWGLMVLLILGIGTTSLANSAPEHQVKVAFIYNFTKFIQWPPVAGQPPSGQIQLCVVGKRPLDDIEKLEGQLTFGRPIVVRLDVPAKEWSQCDILYIAESEAPRVSEILARVATLPILTISDMPDFADKGGIIGLRIHDGRVRFDINLATARRIEMHISSQLLGLAVRVLQ
ncbi:YfiR family protein [Chrysiogenes arsenatis]|uniref:YfiR family protein n=1 Tax=Chrysiogenes arsenatis TaxID=309797 RepID=UPI0003F712EC|nr:YfiR family protein [Chrysiogenes arsenatis]